MKFYEVPKHILKQDFPGRTEFEKEMYRDAIIISKRLRGSVPLEIGQFLERVYTRKLRAEQTHTPLVRATHSAKEGDIFQNGARIWGTDYSSTFMKPFSFTNFLGNIAGAEEWKNSDMAIVAYVPTANLDYTPCLTQPMYVPEGFEDGHHIHRLLPEFVACTLSVKDGQITAIKHNPGFTTRHDYSHKGLNFDNAVFESSNCTIRDRAEAENVLRAGLDACRDELNAIKNGRPAPLATQLAHVVRARNPI